MTYKGLQEYRRNAAIVPTVAGSGGGTAALMNAETAMGRKRGYQPT